VTDSLKALGLASPPATGPAILIFDIETAPALVYTWAAYDQNIIATERDWSVLMFSYKWVNRKGVKPVAIWSDPGYKPGDLDDRYVIERIHALFDAADVTVAHNGDRFDRRKSNARFLYHGMNPPSPYQTVDTKKVSSREFANYKNTLDDLGRMYLGERKITHTGIELWLDCMAGDPAAQRRMERYANQDVRLLERYYRLLIPWMGMPGKPAIAPNYNFWSKGERVCPKCGNPKIHFRGGGESRERHRTLVSEFKVMKCVKNGEYPTACGGWSRVRLREPQPDGGVQLV
jgi:hypothetical protein